MSRVWRACDISIEVADEDNSDQAVQQKRNCIGEQSVLCAVYNSRMIYLTDTKLATWHKLPLSGLCPNPFDFLGDLPLQDPGVPPTVECLCNQRCSTNYTVDLSEIREFTY